MSSSPSRSSKDLPSSSSSLKREEDSYLSSSAEPSLSSSSSSTPAELVEQWRRRLSSTSRQPIPSVAKFHEGVVLKPLKVLITEPGRFVCSLRVPAHLTDSSQVLHPGVIASLVDNVGAAALKTLDGKVRFSVDLNVSYVSSAHIDDEVEVEARVLKYTKSIGVVTVDLTNKSTGQLIAQGRHTMFYSMSRL